MATRQVESAPVRAGVLHRRRAVRSDSARFEKLYELFARLAACNHLDPALLEVLDASIDVVGAHAGLIRLFYYEEADPIASQFPFVAHRGISEDFLNYFSNLDRPVSREGRQAMYDGHRLLIEDMSSHEYYRDHREVVVAEGYRTQLSIPLMSRIGPKCVGVLTTFFREVQTPSHADLETLNLYAELAATTIDNHQHLAELGRREQAWADITEQQANVLRRTRKLLADLEKSAPRLQSQDVAKRARSIASMIEQVKSEPSPTVPHVASDDLVIEQNPYGLSQRELDVMVNVWRGMSEQEMAVEMRLSRFTVAKYLGTAMRKLNVERNQVRDIVGRDLLSTETGANLPFNALLRAYRLRAGLTQTELADKAGLSHRTISDLERGIRKKAYESTVEMLCAALDLEVADAMRMAGSVDRSRSYRSDRTFPEG